LQNTKTSSFTSIGRLLHEVEAFEATRQRYAGLTEREREVLGLIIEGLTNKEIGRAMAVSPRAVETHRANLFEKLEIRHYAALVEEGYG
jgi:two-component system response regulator FixJ